MANASLRQRLAASLEGAAHRQLTRATDFGRGYDELDAQVPRNDRTLMLALQFWDAWIDEHEHGFPNRYAGIGDHNGPRLALALSRSLRMGEVIQDPLLIRHIEVRTPVSLPERLLHLVRRRRHNK